MVWSLGGSFVVSKISVRACRCNEARASLAPVALNDSITPNIIIEQTRTSIGGRFAPRMVMATGLALVLMASPAFADAGSGGSGGAGHGSDGGIAGTAGSPNGGPGNDAVVPGAG